MSESRFILFLQAAVLLMIGALLLSCGSAPSAVFVSDEERTAQLALAEDFGYCHILSDEVCQSPDSILAFHLPRELKMMIRDQSISEELVISNEGFRPVEIDEYFIIVLDMMDRPYRPTFSGPGGYDETKPFAPALRLLANQSEKIQFSAQLEGDYPELQRVTFVYRLKGRLDFQKVIWSFKPRHVEAI